MSEHLDFYEPDPVVFCTIKGCKWKRSSEWEEISTMEAPLAEHPVHEPVEAAEVQEVVLSTYELKGTPTEVDRDEEFAWMDLESETQPIGIRLVTPLFNSQILNTYLGLRVRIKVEVLR